MSDAVDTTSAPDISLHLGDKKDINEFVIPSWLSSYSRSLVVKWMRGDARYGTGRQRYWSSQRDRIEKILGTPGVRVVVATVDGLNAGFSVEQRTDNTLHYVYVKEAFRQQGIAKRLVGWINEAPDGQIVVLTHLPPPWYSRPLEGGKNLWRPHVVIDLISR